MESKRNTAIKLGTSRVRSSCRRAATALAAAAVLAAAIVALMRDTSQAGAQEEFCDVRLTLALDPDVPNVSSEGFLSSLLNRHFNYRLELRGRDDQDASVVEVELIGPGPEYRCEDVIATMRRDARVQSIQVESIRLASRS